MKKTHLFLIIISGFIFSACSSDHREKLKGKIWANTDSRHVIDYLWEFSDSSMINLNYRDGSEDKYFPFSIEGDEITIVRQGKSTTQEIKFDSDTAFAFIKDNNKVNFRLVKLSDKLIGNWETVEDSDKRFAIEFKFSGDGKIFGYYEKYKGVNFDYKISGNSIQIENEDDLDEELNFILTDINHLQVEIDDNNYQLTRKLYN